MSKMGWTKVAVVAGSLALVAAVALPLQAQGRKGGACGREVKAACSVEAKAACSEAKAECDKEAKAACTEAKAACDKEAKATCGTEKCD